MQHRLENLPLKAVARQMPEAVVITDAHGRITWTNDSFEKLCGYSLNEVQGKKPGTLLQGPATDPRTVEEFRIAVQEGLGLRTDILNYHKDGHSYWARVSITPYFHNNGNLEGFIAIERDVTKDHEKYDELHGEVVELYSAILLQEDAKGRKLKPGDPFYYSKLAD